jgi:pimeloyl-ACP methyl ester carboxylesterase
MVAQEMAHSVKPKAVLLIGSCRSPAQIPVLLRILGGIPGWPFAAKGLAKGFPGGRAWFLGAKAKPQRDLLLRMLLDSPNRFLEWTVQAIRRWKGTEGRRIPLHHIHGDRDRLIPIGNVRPDQVISGRGHTISLTHPREVNRFIRSFVQ